MKIELNLQNKKLELIQWLSSIEDSTIIEKIMALRKEESKDWWNSIAESEKEAIERGIQDANAGKLNPHSKARKIYEMQNFFIYFCFLRKNSFKKTHKQHIQKRWRRRRRRKVKYLIISALKKYLFIFLFYLSCSYIK